MKKLEGIELLKYLCDILGPTGSEERVADAVREQLGDIEGLHHKAGDNSVEGEAVVEALLNKRFKVCDGLRRVLGVELKLDLAAVFHFDDYHIFFPFVF